MPRGYSRNPLAGLSDTTHKTRMDYNPSKNTNWHNPNPEKVNNSKGTRLESILKKIRILETRIKKAKPIANAGHNSPEGAEARRKIANWEKHLARHRGYLLEIQRRKDQIDHREQTKFLRKQAIHDGKAVRLEKGKIVPAKGKMTDDEFNRLVRQYGKEEREK